MSITRSSNSAIADGVLSVGQIMKFYLAGREGSFSSRLEDIQEDVLMVAMPFIDKNTPLIPMTGEKLQCKVKGNEYYYTFTSEYIRKDKAPIPVWFIKKPEFVEKVQNRDFVRIKISSSVIVRIPNQEEHTSRMIITTMTDLSGGGIGLVCNEIIAEDTLCEVEFELATEEKPIMKLECRVVVCRPMSDGDKTIYHIGMQFTNISNRQQNQLMRYIFDVQRKMIAKGMAYK